VSAQDIASGLVTMYRSTIVTQLTALRDELLVISPMVPSGNTVTDLNNSDRARLHMTAGLRAVTDSAAFKGWLKLQPDFEPIASLPAIVANTSDEAYMALRGPGAAAGCVGFLTRQIKGTDRFSAAELEGAERLMAAAQKEMQAAAKLIQRSVSLKGGGGGGGGGRGGGGGQPTHAGAGTASGAFRPGKKFHRGSGKGGDMGGGASGSGGGAGAGGGAQGGAGGRGGAKHRE
jgi:hypothetical protein